MDNQQVISVLNGLIETCKDGEQGFKTAAEGLADPQIRIALPAVLPAARRDGS